MRGRFHLSQLTGSGKPQSGETLILSDGRRFRVSSAVSGLRGWWFTATAEDGSSVLQGNLQLDWDARTCVWRPHGDVAGAVDAQHALSGAQAIGLA